MAKPPFAVMRVSKPLPLQNNVYAFASALVFLPAHSKVAVLYGVHDEESRALVASEEWIEGMFDWCA